MKYVGVGVSRAQDDLPREPRLEVEAKREFLVQRRGGQRHGGYEWHGLQARGRLVRLIKSESLTLRQKALQYQCNGSPISANLIMCWGAPVEMRQLLGPLY